ncbi:MAG TPA: OsmC family peroxiredoxin [Anaerolineales bacterium]|nr:OsmC family peroxiredoxin [Anaerolineales bacterium]
MAQFDRKAGVLWTGDLKTGHGLISTESRALFELPYSWPTRFADEVGLNPEELIAAAHAACFSMSVASRLAKNGFTPLQTETTATCTLSSKDAGGHAITNMRLHVRCEVPDIDEDRFNEIVREADENCPVSNLLRSGVNIEITTALITPAGSEGDGKGEAQPLDA